MTYRNRPNRSEQLICAACEHDVDAFLVCDAYGTRSWHADHSGAEIDAVTCDACGEESPADELPTLASLTY